jgi:hypothetical protein
MRWKTTSGNLLKPISSESFRNVNTNEIIQSTNGVYDILERNKNLDDQAGVSDNVINLVKSVRNLRT